MNVSSLRLGGLLAVAFLLVGLFLGYQLFAGLNFDALFLLGMTAMPLSYLAEEVLHGLARANVLPNQPILALEYAALMVVGTLQYFAIGALVAFAWRAAFGRSKDHRRPTDGVS